MKNTIRLLRFLPLVALLLAPVAAHAADPVACVDVNLWASTTEVCAGQTFDLGGSLTNCGTNRDRIYLSIIATGPGVGAQFKAVLGNVRAGATREFSYPVPVPELFPLGSYSLTVTATSRQDAPPDTASVTVSVIDCNGEPGP